VWPGSWPLSEGAAVLSSLLRQWMLPCLNPRRPWLTWASPVLGLAMAARRRQDLSRHSVASPTAHILAEGDWTAWLGM
jgi:hypothetical protein